MRCTEATSEEREAYPLEDDMFRGERYFVLVLDGVSLVPRQSRVAAVLVRHD